MARAAAAGWADWTEPSDGPYSRQSGPWGPSEAHGPHLCPRSGVCFFQLSRATGRYKCRWEHQAMGWGAVCAEGTFWKTPYNLQPDFVEAVTPRWTGRDERYGGYSMWILSGKGFENIRMPCCRKNLKLNPQNTNYRLWFNHFDKSPSWVGAAVPLPHLWFG